MKPAVQYRSAQTPNKSGSHERVLAYTHPPPTPIYLSLLLFLLLLPRGRRGIDHLLTTTNLKSPFLLLFSNSNLKSVKCFIFSSMSLVYDCIGVIYVFIFRYDIRRFGTFRTADPGPNFNFFKLFPNVDLCSSPALEYM